MRRWCRWSSRTPLRSPDLPGSQGATWPTMADPQGPPSRLRRGSPPSTSSSRLMDVGRHYLGPVTANLSAVIQRAKASIHEHVVGFTRPIARLGCPGRCPVVALLVGSGVFSSKPMTNSRRVQSIASGIKCPAVGDLSVANSTPRPPSPCATPLPPGGGGTDGRADRRLPDRRYGSSIVLTPPTSGWSLLVWLLPWPRAWWRWAADDLVVRRHGRPSPGERGRATVARRHQRRDAGRSAAPSWRSLADADRGTRRRGPV